MSKMKLFGEPGWGSVLTEVQLVWYDISFEFHRVDNLFTNEGARSELEIFNPLAQIPTLVLPDGRVMTESAAITLWLAEQSACFDLVPGPNEEARALFLRWLIFITSNIYPTYTYSDVPGRFVPNKSAQNGFKKVVSQYAKKLYLILNEEASSPWFLGERFSALDIYICTMTHWRPGRSWFELNTPDLITIADSAIAIPRLSHVWARNFPED